MYLTLVGDCMETIPQLPLVSEINCCITSPPYFGLRDYGHPGQIGLEPTPDEFVAKLVEVFREVREVMRDDGTLWLNIGDSYARNPAKGGSGPGGKNLIGIPWRVAFALQADGWYLRQDIIWSKPNPMPESVTDRCTKSHEYVFLFSKSPRYYFDSEAIKEPVAAATIARLTQDVDNQAGSDRVPGKTNGPMKAVRSKANSFKRENSKRAQVIPGQSVGTHREGRAESEYSLDTRNKRSVWTVATRGYKGAHFATFPPALIEPCVLAGAPPGGVVLDPFGGSGTTAGVCERLGRDSILCELNPEYAALVPARVESILKAK